MNKFKKGDRVIILDKSCGDVVGLDKMLRARYTGRLEPPSKGTVIFFTRHHKIFGDFYTVEIDNYDSEIHKYREYCFKECDLELELNTRWDINEDLFEI